MPALSDFAERPLVKLLVPALLMICIGIVAYQTRRIDQAIEKGEALTLELTALAEWRATQEDEGFERAQEFLRHEARVLALEIAAARVPAEIDALRGRLDRFERQIDGINSRLERHVDSHQRSEFADDEATAVK